MKFIVPNQRSLSLTSFNRVPDFYRAFLAKTWRKHTQTGFKGQFRYFKHWAPFLVCLGWNRRLAPNVDDWSCLGYLAHLESPLPTSEWLATGIHKLILKTTLDVRFQKCVMCLSCFIWHFVYPIETETGQEPESGLFTFGWSLLARFSISTVGLDRAKRLQPAPFPVPVQWANAYGVFQMSRIPRKMGKSPSFLRNFSEARPLLVVPPQNSESSMSDVMMLSTKMTALVKKLIYSVFVTRWWF